LTLQSIGKKRDCIADASKRDVFRASKACYEVLGFTSTTTDTKGGNQAEWQDTATDVA